MQRWFIEDDARRILQLWDDREIFLNCLDRLPQTLLHRDAFRRNLFTRIGDDGREQTVAVDWTYVGIGAVGEELESLVHGTLCFSEIPTANARQLDAIVFDAYLEGLADAGWHGDPRLIRLSYTAGSAMCFGLGYFWFEPPADSRPWIEQAFGRPFDEIIILSSEIRHFVLELADEARILRSDLEL